MKTKLTYLLLIIGLVLTFTNCKKDSTDPTALNVMTELNGEPGAEITFAGIFSDDFGLAEINIEYLDWALQKTIDLSENPLDYTLDYTFTIPADAEPGVHTVTITATDTSGRSVSVNVTVTVAEGVSYEAIYAVGGFMWWWGWDHPELSYIMYQDQDNPEWFEIVIPVWGGDYNTLKFLGQPDWEGDNWGLVSSDNPSAGMINDASSEAIILDDKGKNPAYYKVRFNPYTLSYTAEEIIPDIPVQETMYIVGNGYPQYPDLDWNTEAAIPMEANYYGYGEHIFGIEGLEFSSDVSMKFIGQNDSWSPVDVGFEVGGEVMAPISWVKCTQGDGTADLKFKEQAGNYTVVYDHFLKRALIWKE